MRVRMRPGCDRDRDDLRRSVSGLVAIAMQDPWHVGFAATAAD